MATLTKMALAHFKVKLRRGSVERLAQGLYRDLAVSARVSTGFEVG